MPSDDSGRGTLQDLMIHAFECPNCGASARSDRALKCYRCGADMERTEWNVGEVTDVVR